MIISNWSWGFVSQLCALIPICFHGTVTAHTPVGALTCLAKQGFQVNVQIKKNFSTELCSIKLHPLVSLYSVINTFKLTYNSIHL